MEAIAGKVFLTAFINLIAAMAIYRAQDSYTDEYYFFAVLILSVVMYLSALAYIWL